MVNESVCIVIALVQKAVSDHKPASAATFRLTVQKMFAILPWVAMGVYEGAVALGVGAAIGGVAGKLYKKYFA